MLVGGTGASNSYPESQPSSALVSMKKRYKPRKRKCFGCGQIGHFRRDCPKRIESENPKSSHKAKTVNKQQLDSDADVEAPGAFAPSDDPFQTEKWLVDSGASSHMTNERNLLVNYREFQTPEKVGLGDGRTVNAVGIGNVHVNMTFKVSKPKKAVMYNVLYVPKLACNLFSVRAAAVKGNFVKFGRTRCWIKNEKGELRGMGSLSDKLYRLDCKPLPVEHVSLALEQGSQMNLWHQRLGHLNVQHLKELVERELASGIKIPKASKLSFCEGCIEGKMHRKSFKSSQETHSTRKMELIHSDVCGPMSVESIGGSKYFVTFIDDYSRCCAVYFMKQKSEVFEKFKEFEAITTNTSGCGIVRLRTDNGGEYPTKEFMDYLKSRGIQHEQNGVAERMNHRLMESTRSMMAHAGVTNQYWAEAIATAAYLRNRAPTSVIKEGKTPYE